MTCYLVAGCGFGDEGKGSIVDYLTRSTGADLIIRYNGGAQCAHNVVLPDGRHHTFAQFGSGTFLPNVRTWLSKYVLVNPITLHTEAMHLARNGVSNAMSRMYIDGRAPVITPFHRLLNRAQEVARGKNRHGSTGMGIGTTRKDHIDHGDNVLLVRDLTDYDTITDKLKFIKAITYPRLQELNLLISSISFDQDWIMEGHGIHWYASEYLKIAKLLTITDEPPTTSKDIIFEGAQGMLIDETWGFQPHTTWTDITFNNAHSILKDMGKQNDASKIGVFRSYFTRHGDGPFPSENPSLLENSNFKELHNTGVNYTGAFRVGDFDLPLAMYALHAIGGVDTIALNHLDVLHAAGELRVRMSEDKYEMLSEENFVSQLSESLECPIEILGTGPKYTDKSSSLNLRSLPCLKSREQYSTIS